MLQSPLSFFINRDNAHLPEQMDIMNAMGTFNILNGEDRRVSCMLVIDPNDESS